MKSDCELEVGAGFYSFLLFEMIGNTEQYFLRLNQKYSSEKNLSLPLLSHCVRSAVLVIITASDRVGSSNFVTLLTKLTTTSCRKSSFFLSV